MKQIITVTYWHVKGKKRKKTGEGTSFKMTVPVTNCDVSSQGQIKLINHILTIMYTFACGRICQVTLGKVIT